ncbi:MAG: succinylglutamate desuccinylase/aspartoacylase family protein, partial [Candidatus Bathyarchaeia archaeon]
ANRLWEIIQESNCYIDLHCMEGPSVPWTIVRGPEAGIVVDRTLEVANAFGLPVTRPSPETRKRRPNTTADWAMSHGIPSIIPELPFPSIFMDERSVEVGVRGVLNVMKLLGMIPGEPEKQDLPIDVRGPIHTVMLAANRGGIVFPLCKLGARVNEGDPLVKIMNVFGDEVELVRAPKNGYLMSFPLNINQIAGTGDFVALLGYTA